MDLNNIKEILSAFEDRLNMKFNDIDNKINELNCCIEKINTTQIKPPLSEAEQYFNDAATQLGKGWGYIENECDDAEIFKAYPMLKNEYLAPDMSDAEIMAEDQKDIDEYLKKHQDFDFSDLSIDIPLSKCQLSS